MNRRHQKILAGLTNVPQEMTVQRVDRSPMNPHRWCLTLSCRHEVWVTAKSKPKRMKAMCPVCVEVA